MAILPPLRPALIFAACAITAAAVPRPNTRAVPLEPARPCSFVYAGRLLRPDHRPLADARVWIEWVHEDGFEEIAELTTNHTGAFSIDLASPLYRALDREPAPRWLGAFALDAPVESFEGTHRSFDATARNGDLVPDDAHDRGFLAVTVDGRASASEPCLGP